MASSMSEIIAQTSENITQQKSETSTSTPEGIGIGPGILIIMAILPIYFGSFRAVKHHKKQQEEYQTSGKKPYTISCKQAAMSPLIASVVLLSLFIIYKKFGEEYVNLILAANFSFLAILALCRLTSPLISSLVSAVIPKTLYHVKFTDGQSDQTKYTINYKFNLHDIVCLICCSIVGAWYLIKKHWIANNLFGIAIAINFIELLQLNNIGTGCILLCGLLFYDVFWVFGTDVMATVAQSCKIPNQLVFPQGLLEKGLSADKFAMLGFGDIVVPGHFIALLLRFDNSLSRKTNLYFYATFFAYFMGLLTTILIAHLFNHAQPALLYLAPACLGTPLLLALIKGDLKALFLYEDHPAQPMNTIQQSEQTTQTQLEVKKDK